jgi:peptidoglycan hydrolase-like protein with peptidoglycan-binding domain
VRAQRGLACVATAGLAALVGGGFGALAPAGAGLAAGAPVAAVTGPIIAAKASGCASGPYQKQVEGYLKKLGGFGPVRVDGRQSAADCAAITKFQKRYGIQPAVGRAGPTTYAVAKRLANTRTSACKAKKSVTTVCIDLTHQTLWVMKSGKVIYKPTVTRTGKNGYRTPTGTYRIIQRAKREWSNPYKVWMPYWQRFVRGIGLHQTTTYLHDGWRGSHGCVNLLGSDAKSLYGKLQIGTTVKVFGRRPGT